MDAWWLDCLNMSVKTQKISGWLVRWPELKKSKPTLIGSMIGAP